MNPTSQEIKGALLITRGADGRNLFVSAALADFELTHTDQLFSEMLKRAAAAGGSTEMDLWMGWLLSEPPSQAIAMEMEALIAAQSPTSEHPAVVVVVFHETLFQSVTERFSTSVGDA